MLIDFLFVYLLIYGSFLSHELLHFGVAELLKIEVIKVNIGFDFLSVKKGKFVVSPIIGPSYVEISKKNMAEKNKIQIFWYFISGILGNTTMLVFLGALYYVSRNILAVIGILVNTVLVIINMLPVSKTDMAQFISYVNNRREKK